MDGRETKMKKKKKKNSGSKMSNKLVHWWLEKFKSSVSSRLNKTGEDYDDDACETQSTISLPRSSLYKLASKRLSELPVFDTGDSQKVQVLSQILYPQAEVFNNSNKLRPESSSKVVESSVSAGCSCGAGISAYTASKWQKKKSSNKFKIEGSDAQKASTTRSSSVASVKNKTMADSGVPKVEELQRRQVIQEHHRSCCCKCSAFCCTCRLSMCPEFKHLQLWSDEDEDYEDDDSSISEVDDVPFLSSSSSSNRATATYDCTRRLVVDMKLKLPLLGDFRESSASLFRRPDSDALDSHAQAQAKIRQMILDRPNNFLDCYNNQLVHTFSRGVAAVAQSKKCLNAIERFKDRQVFHEPPMAANLRSWNVQLPGTTFSQERQPEPEDLPEVKNQSMKTKKIIHSNTSSSPSIKKSAGGGNCSSCGKPKKEGNRNAAADVEANTALNPDSESQRLLNKGGAVEEECALKRSLAEQAKEAESESQTKLGESFAMVKASYDPERDFRESMVEMMVENDIRDPRDLQELLNCYLSLNSVEYHRLILQVFEEIQSDLLNIDP